MNKHKKLSAAIISISKSNPEKLNNCFLIRKIDLIVAKGSKAESERLAELICPT